MKKTYSNSEWASKLEKIKLDKKDLNELVMNYLLIEGYKEAAEAFKVESNTSYDQSAIDDIEQRVSIRDSIQKGDIPSAISKINSIDQSILEKNELLLFKLKQQQLIELIRAGDLDKALVFAQEELAPMGAQNDAFLIDIEKTITLLAYEDSNQCPVNSLLEPSQNHKTASEINAALLQAQSKDNSPKLLQLLKFLIYLQRMLDEKANYPKLSLSDMKFSTMTAGGAASATGSGSDSER